jgi:purine-binding chemotaxis protein CheW
MSTHKLRTESEKLVGFRVGDVGYAVGIGAVREIVNPLPLTLLPHVPKAVAGVADHRGEVVPVIDLRARFGLTAANAADRSKWILVGIESRTVGLMVDQVTEVFAASDEELRPAPDLGGGEDERGIASVTSHGGEMVFVLDVTRFRDLVASVPSIEGGSHESRDS